MMGNPFIMGKAANAAFKEYRACMPGWQESHNTINFQ